MLPLLLLALPFVELAVLVVVAQQVGVLTTMLLVILVSIVGVWVAKASGLGVLRRMQATVRAGRAPSAEVVDGALVVAAGILLALPGFVTDGIGVLLLLPPTRAVARSMVLRRVRRGSTWIVGVRDGRGSGSAATIDAESWEAGGPGGQPGRRDGPDGPPPSLGS